MTKRLYISAIAFLSMISALAQQWALVNIPVANIRSKPGNPQEMSSQELMGMPVLLSDLDNGWWKVKTADEYDGYIRDESVFKLSKEDLENWQNAPRLVVSSYNQITAYDSPFSKNPRNIVITLVPNSIVKGNLDNIVNDRIEISLPDGRKAWALANDFITIEEWASLPLSQKLIMDQAYSLMGSPYLWGGASTKAVDCSGLVKTCYLKNGIFLRRDARLQAPTGQQLDIKKWKEFEPGDLLYFGVPSTGKVTHVGIYDHDGIYIHSTGKGDNVRINSLDPESAIYNPIHLLSAMRVKNMINTPGIVKADSHPWLFNK